MATVLSYPRVSRLALAIDPLEEEGDEFEDNWWIWSMLMEDLLRDLNYWKYTSGEHERPSDSEPGNDSKADAVVVWTAADRRALSTIRSRVGRSVVRLVRHANSSREAWDALKAYFEAPYRKSNQVVSIHRQLLTAQYNEDEEEFDKWLSRMRTWDEKLEWLGQPLGEHMFTHILLRALPGDAWRDFRMSVRIEDHADRYELIGRIRAHATYIYTATGGRRTQPRQRRPPPRCFTCGKIGLARECPNHERKKKRRP